MHGMALVARHFYDRTQGATPGIRSTPRSSWDCELMVLLMLAARLTFLDDATTRQPLAHSAPPTTICQPLDGTPSWPLGLADQAQVYHHITKRASLHARQCAVRSINWWIKSASAWWRVGVTSGYSNKKAKKVEVLNHENQNTCFTMSAIE